VILLFESLALRCFLRDTAGAGSDFAVALLVGVPAAFLPYGFLIAMVTGTRVYPLAPRVHLGSIGEMSK
jgi:hypothetical protein